MASVYKVRKTWTVAWFDRSGQRHFARGLRTRELAVQIGEKREFHKTLAKHGLTDRNADKYAQEADRPLEKHLNEYQAALLAKGDTEQHAKEMKALATRMLDKAKIERIDELDRYAVLTAVTSLKEAGRSHRTRNKALAACKAFCGWLFDAGRIPHNTFARMHKLDEEQDRRRVRREITEDEAVNILEATAAGPLRGGMTPVDRMIRYAIGFGTGFRQSTLFSLMPESFHLQGDPPFIHVEATDTKGRKSYDQPISEDLAELLRPWLIGKHKGKAVFTKLRHAKPAISWRADLKAAGVEYHDEDSNIYADQHAQRNSYITAIIRAAGLKVAQDLAHHSTPVLTSKYGRMTMDDYSKGLIGLPKLTRRKAGRRAG